MLKLQQAFPFQRHADPTIHSDPKDGYLLDSPGVNDGIDMLMNSWL